MQYEQVSRLDVENLDSPWDAAYALLSNFPFRKQPHGHDVQCSVSRCWL